MATENDTTEPTERLIRQMKDKDHHSTITELPSQERPREKLLACGPHTLTNPELLAIFLRVGVPGKSAIDLARDLLSRFGSLRGLYAAPIEELQSVSGLGPAKIAQFLAAIEMSKRYLSEGLGNRPFVESADDVRKLLYQEMRDLDQEVFKLILLNGQNHILKICDVGTGSLTSAKIYPREVVKAALRYSAAAVVVVHNHPSGVAKPSIDDEAVTRDLVFLCVLLGMQLHDHIIIGDNETFSFADAGLITRYIKEVESR